MADIGTLNPEQLLQQQQILRQQKMAEMLLQQGQQQPQGQMVSGRYVAPSIFQNLAGLANQYVGQKGIERAQQAQLDLAKAIRQGDIAATADFMKTRQGTPAEMFAAQAGPMPDGGNIPIQEARAAIAPNPQAAYANLAVDPRASARLQNIGFNKMFAEPEAFTLTEGAKRFMTMPDGTVKEVAAGGQKPRSPVSVGNYLVDPESGKVIFQAPEKPTAGQVVEREDGTFLVDTRTGQARPVMGVGGQQLAGKPKVLPEGLNKQVTGSINLSDAITDYQSKIKSFGVKDFANPDKRAEMGNAYNNMMLQAKEAYNLGVLNGPDYDILQKVVRDPTNPSSLLFKNAALDKQAESLRSTAQNIVRTAYMSQGREVPADIASKLKKPTKETGMFASESDAQKAFEKGKLKVGDKITINGVTGTWK